MKLLLAIVLAVLALVDAKASIIPVNPLGSSYSVSAAPLATSYQVVSRNVNRVVVPHVPSITTSLAYPGYATTWAGYPYGYRGGYGYGYGYPHNYGYGYGYGYPYGYGTTVW
ncbi:uncharacterized protein ACRADG_002633 [Cochliomyia hominivorax]